MNDRLRNTYGVSRGALMHSLQGAEAQGPTLERGPLAVGKLYYSNNYLYGSLEQWQQHSVNKLTHSFSATPWFSLGSPHTVCVVGMFHRYTTVRNAQSINTFAHFASKVTLAQHKCLYINVQGKGIRETTLLCERNWTGQLSVTWYSASSVICVVSVEGFR